MSVVVKIAENEIILSGTYMIPIATPYLSIYIPERKFLFKMTFEETSDEILKEEKFKRIKINKAEPKVGDVTFCYKPNELGFKSTKKPNDLFSSFRTEDGVRLKTQYQYNIHFNVDRKNSIEVKIQITKCPEVIYKEEGDE